MRPEVRNLRTPLTQNQAHGVGARRRRANKADDLVGNGATRHNLARLLESGDYNIIHFAGHGTADSSQGSGVLLADGLLPFERLLSGPVKGSMVFLSACGAGDQMNETSKQF